jgi:hypothetical protein
MKRGLPGIALAKTGGAEIAEEIAKCGRIENTPISSLIIPHAISFCSCSKRKTEEEETEETEELHDVTPATVDVTGL